MYVPRFFFFNDPATTEIYTLSLTTLFRSMFDSWSRFVTTISSPSSKRRAEASSRTSSVDEPPRITSSGSQRSEEHTSELQSQFHLVCRLLLEKKKNLSCFTTSS